MIGFRLSAQKPPEAKRIKDDVIMRFDHTSLRFSRQPSAASWPGSASQSLARSAGLF